MSVLARFAFILWITTGLAAPAHAADQPQQPQGQGGSGERIDVDRIRRNYWNRIEDNETRVVQNRLYSKARKLELGLYAATISGDPFLSVKSFGLLAGYHLNEEWGIFGVFWKTSAGPSSARDFLEQDIGVTSNGNLPRDYKGAEVMWSPVYGKLAVLGKLIIHYDLHLLGGLGFTGNESNDAFTLSGGIGQQIYITDKLSIRLDYRLMRYTEDVIAKQTTNPRFGQVINSRTNFSDVISIGVDFLVF
ncbi:MAG TPA: outer membrane beta-barrel domain-containing protein [Bdellovibrionota bacterium]|nr:outer membrane beta-barrel domain-containing protein [Bdellovibrionota bacterium]